MTLKICDLVVFRSFLGVRFSFEINTFLERKNILENGKNFPIENPEFFKVSSSLPPLRVNFKKIEENFL